MMACFKGLDKSLDNQEETQIWPANIKVVFVRKRSWKATKMRCFSTRWTCCRSKFRPFFLSKGV